MVSHRQSHLQKRSVSFSHGKNGASLCRYNKVKKKVTWDKSIALREEELWELENELQGRKEALPIVTFIRKYDPRIEADDPYPVAELGSRPGQAIVFMLEDGRVDVSEILGQLGASRVDVEQEPGVWHTLEGLASGKSKRKFQNGQVVLFRIIPNTHSQNEDCNASRRDKSPLKCKSAVSHQQITTISQPQWSLRKSFLTGKWSPWLDKWIVGGDSLEDYYGRVGRLIEDRRDQGGGICGIGIALRLAFHHKHTTLLLTCRHMVAQEGETSLGTRGRLFAFGGPVKVLHTSKKYDLALLQGPPVPGSKGFDLAAEGEEQPGREIRLLTFPWYLDNVWGQLPLKDVQPAEMPGRISYMGASQQNASKPLIVDALATYMGGLPGCSGGAVTLNSKLLCGVHSGVYPFRSQAAGMASAIIVAENNSTEQFKNHRSQTVTDTRTKTVPRLLRLAKKQNSQPLQFAGSGMFNKCSATHGYLAVYVSSTHIRETCLEWYTKPGIKKILDNLLPF